MTRLNARTKLRSDEGTTYEVAQRLGQGGFGTTYSGYRLSARGRRMETICLKVCRDRHDWHGEAFFGRLLAGNRRVVHLRDAFVAATGSGSQQRRRHVLVFEFMQEGTVWDALAAGAKPWSETKVRREIKAILKVLIALHNSGVTHRDLKPDNVYLRENKLVLGDFGISKMSLDPSHSFVSAFAPDFAPSNVLRNYRWAEADDVFQVGLLAATLLDGEIWWTDTVSVQSIAALPASDEFKSWIWHATGAKSQRYWNAADAVDALDSLNTITLASSQAPRTLHGHSIVFTGKLDGFSRPEANALVRQAGAMPQTRVNDRTSLVVRGKLKASIAGEAEGLKLFSARERLRRGQDIRVLDEAQFKRLIRSWRKS